MTHYYRDILASADCQFSVLMLLHLLLLPQVSKNGIDLWVTSSLSHNTSDSVNNNSSRMGLSNFSSSSSSYRPGQLLPAGITSFSWIAGLTSSSATASLAAAGGPTAATQSTTAAAAAAVGFQALSFAAAAAASSGSSSSCLFSFPLAVTPPHTAANSSSSTSKQPQEQQPQQQQQPKRAQPRPSRRLLLNPAPPSALNPQQGTPKPHHTQPVVYTPNPRSWLGFSWKPAPLDPDMVRFLKGLGIISGLNTLATLARAFTFAAAGMAAARSVHRRLLAAVLAAPLAAFDTQPAGRLLNRWGGGGVGSGYRARLGERCWG